jgi:hypothetical protein
MRQRDRSLKVESPRLHRIITVFSDVIVKRRPYQDSILRITDPDLGGEGEIDKINILLIQAQQKAIVE